jgi:hypothetical protein
MIKVPLPTKEGEEPMQLKTTRRHVNEALHALGCKIRLRWKTEKVTVGNGTVQNRHRFVRGRLRLGQIKVSANKSPALRAVVSWMPG